MALHNAAFQSRGYGDALLAARAVGDDAAAGAAIPDDGSVLPFPRTPSASKAGPTLQESTHQRRVEPARLPQDAPNVLIILIDDLGFGTTSTFGGPIPTPRGGGRRCRTAGRRPARRWIERCGGALLR